LLDAVGGVAAAPRFPPARREGGAAAGAHGEPAGASRGGAGGADRVPAREPGGGGGRLRDAGGRRGVMLTPAVETRPWEEQLRLDDEAYRAQLAYLFERSQFYRAKL